MQSVHTRLDQLIRARYPIIAVESNEERRVVRAIQGVARSKAVVGWTVTRGFAALDDQSCTLTGEGADPIAALQSILAYTGKPTLFVLRDLHPFLPDAIVTRALRDIAAALTDTKHTVILVSPHLAVPPDLEKDIVVLDFPLPDESERATLLHTFADDLPDGVPVHLNGDTGALVEALSGLTETEILNVLASAAIATGELAMSAIGEILKLKAQIIKASGVLEFFPSSAAYDQIGGLDALKAYVREREGAFSREAASYGIEQPRGVLMVGVPGAGKSLTAKVVGGGVRPLLRLDMGALMGSLVGESEGKLRLALRVAEAVRGVLWFDEIEKALGGTGDLDGGTSLRMVGTLLTWMQEQQAGVYVVATANDVRGLRPELLRRFDDIFWVDLPDADARADIFCIHLRKRGRDADSFDLAALAEAANGFTGAEIEKAVQSALFRGWSDNRRAITTADVLLAVTTTVPISRTMSTQIEELRAWAKDRARPATRSVPTTARQDAGRILEL